MSLPYVTLKLHPISSSIPSRTLPIGLDKCSACRTRRATVAEKTYLTKIGTDMRVQTVEPGISPDRLLIL